MDWTAPKRGLLATVAAAGPALTAIAATASPPPGPDWEEGSLNSGDAGSLPDSVQVPHGQPPGSSLEMIVGVLEGLSPGTADFQDMYLVDIPIPSLFVVEANPPVGVPVLDTHLWLFDTDGFGILGNMGTDNSSGFGSASDDGSGSVISVPGRYLLAISAGPSVPVDAADEDLFDFDIAGEVSGPDGRGGANAVSDWTTAIEGGEYTIVLSGAAYVPCQSDITADGLVDVEDLVLVILEWGPCTPGGPCPADIDGDGCVGVTDLVEVILRWNTCLPTITPM